MASGAGAPVRLRLRRPVPGALVCACAFAILLPAPVRAQGESPSFTYVLAPLAAAEPEHPADGSRARRDVRFALTRVLQGGGRQGDTEGPWEPLQAQWIHWWVEAETADKGPPGRDGSDFDGPDRPAGRLSAASLGMRGTACFEPRNPTVVLEGVEVFSDDLAEARETFVLSFSYATDPLAPTDPPVGCVELRRDVARVRSALAQPKSFFTVGITDHRTEQAPELTSQAGPLELEVAETDRDFRAALVIETDRVSPATYCYPFRLVVGRGTASDADVWTAGGGPGGYFALPVGSSLARSDHLVVVGDTVSEADETFHLDFYDPVVGDSCSPPFGAGGPPRWEAVVVIVDDDEPDGGGLPWFGLDPARCPDAPSVLAVTEPPAADGLVAVSFELVHRVVTRGPGPGPENPDGAGGAAVCQEPVSDVVEVTAVLARAGGGGAEPGVDIVLPPHSRLLRFYRDQPVAVELLVRGDGLAEGAERIDLLLGTGRGGNVRLSVVIEDHELRVEVAAGRAASLTRSGRLLGSAVTGALAARFSCAGSAACDPFEDESETLFPGGGRVPAGRRGAAAARRLGQAARVLLPAGAPAAGPAGLGRVGRGFRHRAAAVMGPAAAGDPLRRVGRLVEALSSQGDLLGWLDPSARRPRSPWSVWFRGSSQMDRDAAGAGRSVETGLVTAVAGVDRRVGRVRIGGLYGWSFGAYSRRHGAGSHATDVADVPVSWQFAAPYVGVAPHPRVRLWTSVGAAWGGPASGGPGAEASTGAAPGGAEARVGLWLYSGGGSLSLARAGVVELELEGDVFRVRVEHGGGGVIGDASSALRGRAGVRAGMRVGGPRAPSHLSLAVWQRWDAGRDLEWVRRLGPRAVAMATDLGVDYRWQRPGSRLAWTAAAEVEVVGGGGGAHRSKRVSAGGGLRWGASETGEGWSLAVRPGYGPAAGLGPSAWWDAAAPGAASLFGPARPRVDTDVGYVFAGGAAAVVTASSPLAGGGPDGLGLERGASVALRFDRGW